VFVAAERDVGVGCRMLESGWPVDAWHCFAWLLGRSSIGSAGSEVLEVNEMNNRTREERVTKLDHGNQRLASNSNSIRHIIKSKRLIVILPLSTEQ
jgi:hypothetical protein